MDTHFYYQSATHFHDDLVIEVGSVASRLHLEHHASTIAGLKDVNLQALCQSAILGSN
jgi:hypothetical protein